MCGIVEYVGNKQSMKMKALQVLILLTICLIGNIFAQKKEEKPNFSGTWELNPKESGIFSASPSLNIMYKREMFLRCNIKIVIAHNEPELKITQTSICKTDKNSNDLKTTTVEYIYFTDKRGEVNGYSDNLRIESITKWSGKRIVINIYENNIKTNKKINISNREISISKNKKKLNETIYRESVANGNLETLFDSIRTKLVYKLIN